MHSPVSTRKKSEMESPDRSPLRTDLEAANLELEFQSDAKFSLSLSGINLRIISGIGDTVCILNKSHFLELLQKNREIINIDSIKMSEKLVILYY